VTVLGSSAVFEMSPWIWPSLPPTHTMMEI
jgi:hypothetical protein